MSHSSFSNCLVAGEYRVDHGVHLDGHLPARQLRRRPGTLNSWHTILCSSN
jgi:hypothetical protein